MSNVTVHVHENLEAINHFIISIEDTDDINMDNKNIMLVEEFMLSFDGMRKGKNNRNHYIRNYQNPAKILLIDSSVYILNADYIKEQFDKRFKGIFDYEFVININKNNNNEQYYNFFQGVVKKMYNKSQEKK